MSIIERTAREVAGDFPCVVIDQDSEGNVRVYADGDVQIYIRNEHVPRDKLYRYAPPQIPDGWLDRPAGFCGDGSEAEFRALVISELRAFWRHLAPSKKAGKRCRRPPRSGQ